MMAIKRAHDAHIHRPNEHTMDMDMDQQGEPASKQETMGLDMP